MSTKLFKPFVADEAKKRVLQVLSSDYLAEGPVVKQFEHEFAAKFGLRNVVSVNSGTSALELAYELAGIEHGSEVLTPVLTCTATNLPLVRRGAHLTFYDIDYDLNANIEDIERKITKKTKAIVFVHFGGNARGLRQILEIGRDRGITIIEDAAQSVGSEYYGEADFTAISLQAIKTLTAGDGGFLICKRQGDYEKAKRLRWFGYDREKKHKLGDTDLKEAGYKYHMNDINAAIGLGNLHHIDAIFEHRAKLKAIYAKYGIVCRPWLAVGYTRNYKKLKQLMAENGIEVGQHHYRNDKYTIFKKFKNDCPVMDKLEGKYVFFPYHHGVSERMAHKIGKLAQLWPVK